MLWIAGTSPKLIDKVVIGVGRMGEGGGRGRLVGYGVLFEICVEVMLMVGKCDGAMLMLLMLVKLAGGS